MISASVLQIPRPDGLPSEAPKDGPSSATTSSPPTSPEAASRSYADAVKLSPSSKSRDDLQGRSPGSTPQRSPATPSSAPLHITFETRPLSQDYTQAAREARRERRRSSRSSQDPERQHLIPAEGNGGASRMSRILPMMAAVLVLMAVFGLGGWFLGRGEGGDRWPGGPH